MGQRARPISQRIRAAIEYAGRPLTRLEISGLFISNHPASAVRAELDRMLAARELVDAGFEPRSHTDPFPELGPRQLYGLPTTGAAGARTPIQPRGESARGRKSR